MTDSPINNYFQELQKKFEFIEEFWVTDYEGALIAGSKKQQNIENEEESERNNKIKVSLSFLFNSAMDQISKIEKWKTKNLVTIYDNYTIYQARVNKSVFIHILCLSKNFNYEIMREITSDISEKLTKIEKELENLTQSNENN